MSNLGPQFTEEPSLTTTRVSGLLSRTGLPRYKETRTSGRGLADAKSRVSENSGLHIEPEKQSFNVHGSDRRPKYVTKYSGRYAISYRGGGDVHSSEDIEKMLGYAKDHFVNHGLKVTPHPSTNAFWVHE